MDLGERISFIFSAFFGALILLLGIGLLATDVFSDRIVKPNRTYLGLLFIAYGIYRAYRARLQYVRMKRER